MKPTLVVLAAGMGSRYGGIKQIDPVGRMGEAILDYSVFDAQKCGFDKVVFVIRKDIESDFREAIGDRISSHIHVEYAFQSLDDIPVKIPGSVERTKPWGTAHATYAARSAVSEPFAVINADDFYGRDAYKQLSSYLSDEKRKEGEYAIVGYKLANTMSPFGSVSRGICTIDEQGYLTDVKEHTKIYKEVDATLSDTEEGNIKLSGDEIVSMNMFAFTPGVFEELDRLFADFLKENATIPTSEFYIPAAVTSLINSGKASMKVLESSDSWFGVTYKEDKPEVVRRIGELIDSGSYPSPLWSSTEVNRK